MPLKKKSWKTTQFYLEHDKRGGVKMDKTVVMSYQNRFKWLFIPLII